MVICAVDCNVACFVELPSNPCICTHSVRENGSNKKFCSKRPHTSIIRVQNRAELNDQNTHRQMLSNLDGSIDGERGLHGRKTDLRVVTRGLFTHAITHATRHTETHNSSTHTSGAEMSSSLHRLLSAFSCVNSINFLPMPLF